MTTSRVGILRWMTVVDDGNLDYYFFARTRKGSVKKARAFLEALP